MRHMKISRDAPTLHDKSDRLAAFISYIVMGLAGLLAILPCLNVVAKALSSASAVNSGAVSIWPKGFQTETLAFILKETTFLQSLKNTLIATTLGTLVSVFATVTTAYPLSKPGLKGRKAVLMLYIFSMLFYGGMIPAYMVIKTLGLINSYAALILPFAIVQFNMLIVKNYFETLPESLEESAQLDGAGYFSILFRIVWPLSMPVTATVALLYAVNYWNNYFHAFLYINKAAMKTLQIYLHDMMYSGGEMMEKLIVGHAENISLDGLQAAAVVLSIIPIILFYPYVQRFFIKGITIGSVKG